MRLPILPYKCTEEPVERPKISFAPKRRTCSYLGDNLRDRMVFLWPLIATKAETLRADFGHGHGRFLKCEVDGCGFEF